MRIHLDWTFDVRDIPAEALFAEADKITDALLDLEATDPQLTDSTVSADRAHMQVSIEISYTGDDYLKAVDGGMCAVRTAIHASGGATHDWPTLDRFIEGEMRTIPA